MDCSKMIELMSAYLDGELSLEEEKQLKSHLDQCSLCREYLQELEQLDEAIRKQRIEPVEDFSQRVMARINQETKPVQRTRWGWRYGIALAASLMMALAGMLAIGGNKGQIPMVSAQEIVHQMAETLAKVETYHVQVVTEIPQVQKGKKVTFRETSEEYMKKPNLRYFKTTMGRPTDEKGPYSRIEIADGRKTYYEHHYDGKVDSTMVKNQFQVNYPATLNYLTRNKVLVSIDKAKLSLTGMEEFNGRKVYKVEAKVADTIDDITQPGQGETYQPVMSQWFTARQVFWIDRETWIPLKIAWYKEGEQEPYRHSTFKVFEINKPINNQVFHFPAQGDRLELYGWREKTSLAEAVKGFIPPVKVPAYLPEGAKLVRVGRINNQVPRVRLEYTVGNEIFQVTYGAKSEQLPTEDTQIVKGLKYYGVMKNVWYNHLAVLNGENYNVIEGTLPLEELRKIVDSTVDAEVRKAEAAKRQAREGLLKQLRGGSLDVKASNEPWQGVFKSFKGTFTWVREDLTGKQEVNRQVIYFKKPYYSHQEFYAGADGQELMAIDLGVGSVRVNIASDYNRPIYESDENARTVPNPFMDVSGFNPVAERKQGQWKAQGEEKVIGRAAEKFEVTYPANYYLTKQVVWLDKETGYALKIISHQQDGTKVTKEFTEFMLNPWLSDDLFKLPSKDQMEKNQSFALTEATKEEAAQTVTFGLVTPANCLQGRR